MVYEEHLPGVFEPKEKGDNVEGVLIKVQENVGVNNKMLYTLENGDNIISVWGSTVLDGRMVGIKLDQKIQIVYKGLGEAKAGQNAPKLFSVYVDKPEKKEEPKAKTIR